MGMDSNANRQSNRRRREAVMIKPITIKGKLVLAICGMGATITLLLDNGETRELPIHRRDFEKRIGGLMWKQVVWKHEYGKMPTICSA